MLVKMFHWNASKHCHIFWIQNPIYIYEILIWLLSVKNFFLIFLRIIILLKSLYIFKLSFCGIWNKKTPKCVSYIILRFDCVLIHSLYSSRTNGNGKEGKIYILQHNILVLVSSTNNIVCIIMILFLAGPQTKIVI